MDINKTIIVICVIVILVSSWHTASSSIRKERFMASLDDQYLDIDKGISNTQPTANANVFYKEMSLDDMNTLLQRTIDRYLQSQLKDKIGEPSLSSPNSNTGLETVASDYITSAINSKLAVNEPQFKVLQSQISKIRTIDNVDLCTIHLIIHREAKQIGFSIVADVAIKWSNSQAVGITDVKAVGYISEDVLLMTKGYDSQTVQSDAFNVDHTIMKTSQYEQIVLEQQADGLFKDRGIKAKNPT